NLAVDPYAHFATASARGAHRPARGSEGSEIRAARAAARCRIIVDRCRRERQKGSVPAWSFNRSADPRCLFAFVAGRRPGVGGEPRKKPVQTLTLHAGQYRRRKSFNYRRIEPKCGGGLIRRTELLYLKSIGYRGLIAHPKGVQHGCNMGLVM